VKRRFLLLRMAANPGVIASRKGRESIRAAVNTFGFVFGHGFSFYRKLFASLI
jgi:hypothetical protein